MVINVSSGNNIIQLHDQMNRLGLSLRIANRVPQQIPRVSLTVDRDNLCARNDFRPVGGAIPANIYDVAFTADDQAN